MRILVLGARGNLGSQIVEVLQERKLGIVYAWARNECNVLDACALFSNIKRLRPDIVINTVAYNNVDACENNLREQKKAIDLNVILVERLALICLELNCKLIQFSTNYVFSGDEHSYSEDACPSPINFYGLTKATGEKTVKVHMERGLDACIIRVSNLFGKKGESELSKKCFFDIMLEKSRNGDLLNVIGDEMSCFAYTRDIANKIADMLCGKNFNGVYHLVNERPVSWYEALCIYSALSGNDIKINLISSKDFPRAAKRPKTAILQANRIGYMRDFKEALREYIEECDFRNNL